MNFTLPSIFFTTVLSVIAILSLATLIGRIWGGMFPYLLRGPARFYLSPALGLATLTIIASLLGRLLILGNSVVVPLLVLSLMVAVLAQESRVGLALRHATQVSAFGLICGVSILGPLLVYGAFNAHNDGFTYLTHSNWLQEHSFSDTIHSEQVTPLISQVFLYQQGGFRMGGSFLLALAQSLLNLQWSYEAYPAVVISAIAACCLAIGFPLARSLRTLHRATRFGLLALPAFTYGGLVFGANYGFLPQTIGLSIGAGLLFTVGPSLQSILVRASSTKVAVKLTLPAAVLFAATVFAYSELAPFVMVSILGSGFLLAFRFRDWGKISLYIGLVLGISSLLLNTELLRAYTALRVQSGAVVGTPVDWSLLGYVAHAVGMHGGAWDVFQWTMPSASRSIISMVGLILTCIVGVIVLLGRQSIRRTVLCDVLMPSALIFVVFSSGLIYFRYFVPTPFPIGVGQSWSQFKLADWAHPFAMAFFLLALLHLRLRIKKYFNHVVIFIFFTGLISATQIALARIAPLAQYYGGTQDLNRFYLGFRQAIIANCMGSAPVFLALNGKHLKFRQMAAYYLPDREVKSDWMDDNYILSKLPAHERVQPLNAGDCVVEPISQVRNPSQGTTFGPFHIGMLEGNQGQVRIAQQIGAYPQESDGKNWWHWVERKVSFKLQPLLIPNEATQTKINFEYIPRGKQSLTLSIIKRDGSSQVILLQSEGNATAMIEKIVDLPPVELAEISIETDGKATPLGNRDPRVAAWMIRNLNITPVLP